MSSKAANSIDRLIQSFYGATVDDGLEFRSQALRKLCKAFSACGAAWLTLGNSREHGEFSQWPADFGQKPAQLAALKFPVAQREVSFALSWRQAQLAESAIAVCCAHRGADLRSIVVLHFQTQRPDPDRVALRRLIGHMIEAGTLSLRNLLQRDEWLQAMGRSSRGCAALVDAQGTLYAASARFRELLGRLCGDPDFRRLPCALPAAALAEGQTFAWNELRFRVSPHGGLYLIHARAPLPIESLSRREQEIARALGSGKTFKTVARECDLAVSTVANHATRIYRKLGVFRREELVQVVRSPPELRVAQ